jgi:hypothetical protein
MLRTLIQNFYSPFATIHADAIAGFEHGCGVETAHYSRDTQFARDDSSMGKWGTHIGDNCRSTGEDGCPADVGGNRYQDFSSL